MNYLILDIETIKAPDAESFKPEFTEPKLTKDGKPYANSKTIEEQESEWLKDCPLHPLTGQIAVIGINCNGKIEQIHSDTEENNITWFWNYYESCFKQGYLIITFNGKHFDLPFLSLRGLRYDINPAWNFEDRFNKQIKDVYEYIIQGNAYDPRWKKVNCDKVFKFFGLEPKLDNGSNFGELWATDKKKALAYNKDELIKLEKVAKRIYQL